MGQIIVGYDGSDCARAALDTAADAAIALSDELVVVFAYEINRMGGEVEDYAKSVQERADEVLGHAKSQAAAKGVEIETVVVQEKPAAALVRLADERDARLIVVGTRGESPLKGALVGSTPHKLIQLADRPVVVVPS
jgi:nucleotide-binding universal stress UspA family protein